MQRQKSGLEDEYNKLEEKVKSLENQNTELLQTLEDFGNSTISLVEYNQQVLSLQMLSNINNELKEQKESAEKQLQTEAQSHNQLKLVNEDQHSRLTSLQAICAEYEFQITCQGAENSALKQRTKQLDEQLIKESVTGVMNDTLIHHIVERQERNQIDELTHERAKLSGHDARLINDKIELTRTNTNNKSQIDSLTRQLEAKNKERDNYQLATISLLYILLITLLCVGQFNASDSERQEKNNHHHPLMYNLTHFIHTITSFLGHLMPRPTQDSPESVSWGKVAGEGL